MRRQNSEFVTAFTTAADEALKNTDSFAYVELDSFACYVIADGIDDKIDVKSARLAVDSVIAAFTESPSMSSRALRRYMNIANRALINSRSRRRLKASVTIVVHNYIKMRYAQAGNTRLRLYRSGFLKEQSADQSLSMEMVDENRLEKDKLAIHQERNNLYCYVGGRKNFNPFISKKIKLTSTDAIALYTRGIWENVDEGELKDVFADATNDPEETVGTIEDLLFSKQPEQLEKYTLVILFVQKTFEDPNRKRRIKKILTITIPLTVIMVGIIVILVVRNNKRKDKIHTMNVSFFSAVEYIQADNYIRAKTECENALNLAVSLKVVKMQKDAESYLRLVESVIAGDDFLKDSQYEDALTQYQNALDQARYADYVGSGYIENKQKRTSDYMSVYELISLGDTLALNLQYKKAEEKYLEAKAIASQIYFDKGREAAMAALEKLYGDMMKIQEENSSKAQEKAEQQAGSASVLAAGDKAFTEGDYEGALVYYVTALQKYRDLDDTTQAEVIEQKIERTQKKIDDQTRKAAVAEDYMVQAEVSYLSKDYILAKKYYLLAKNIYAQVKNDEMVMEIIRKLEMIDLDMSIEAMMAMPENPSETEGKQESETEMEVDEVGGNQTDDGAPEASG